MYKKSPFSNRNKIEQSFNNCIEGNNNNKITRITEATFFSNVNTIELLTAKQKVIFKSVKVFL